MYETIKRLYANFNSQPHKEADLSCTDAWAEDEVFQLTASQGG